MVRAVVNAVFELPFAVRYQSRSNRPLVLRTRGARFVLYPLEDGIEPASVQPELGVVSFSRRTRTAVRLTRLLGIEFRWPSARVNDHGAAVEHATWLARQLMSLIRWRTTQAQINPSALARPAFTQVFDAGKIGRSPLGRHVQMSSETRAEVARSSDAPSRLFLASPRRYGTSPSVEASGPRSLPTSIPIANRHFGKSIS